MKRSNVANQNQANQIKKSAKKEIVKSAFVLEPSKNVATQAEKREKQKSSTLRNKIPSRTNAVGTSHQKSRIIMPNSKKLRHTWQSSTNTNKSTIIHIPTQRAKFDESVSSHHDTRFQNFMSPNQSQSQDSRLTHILDSNSSNSVVSIESLLWQDDFDFLTLSLYQLQDVVQKLWVDLRTPENEKMKHLKYFSSINLLSDDDIRHFATYAQSLVIHRKQTLHVLTLISTREDLLKRLTIQLSESETTLECNDNLTTEILQFLESTKETVYSIVEWMQQVSDQKKFLWRKQEYLKKIMQDLETLSQSQHFKQTLNSSLHIPRFKLLYSLNDIIIGNFNGLKIEHGILKDGSHIDHILIPSNEVETSQISLIENEDSESQIDLNYSSISTIQDASQSIFKENSQISPMVRALQSNISKASGSHTLNFESTITFDNDVLLSPPASHSSKSPGVFIQSIVRCQLQKAYTMKSLKKVVYVQSVFRRNACIWQFAFFNPIIRASHDFHATQIQRVYRGYRERRSIEKYIVEVERSLCILQPQFRRLLAKKQFERKRMKWLDELNTIIKEENLIVIVQRCIRETLDIQRRIQIRLWIEMKSAIKVQRFYREYKNWKVSQRMSEDEFAIRSTEKMKIQFIQGALRSNALAMEFNLSRTIIMALQASIRTILKNLSAPFEGINFHPAMQSNSIPSAASNNLSTNYCKPTEVYSASTSSGQNSLAKVKIHIQNESMPQKNFIPNTNALITIQCAFRCHLSRRSFLNHRARYEEEQKQRILAEWYMYPPHYEILLQMQDYIKRLLQHR